MRKAAINWMDLFVLIIYPSPSDQRSLFARIGEESLCDKVCFQKAPHRIQSHNVPG